MFLCIDKKEYQYCFVEKVPLIRSYVKILPGNYNLGLESGNSSTCGLKGNAIKVVNIF